ncbi:hypothetical protein Tco_1470560, partial [Tanacetum coccineum]
MYYPRFTKVIVDYFMAKDPSISRRNKMFWHTTRDDSMFTTIRVISKHQDTQLYGDIQPQHLTNQVMLESKAYKEYLAYASGKRLQAPSKVTKPSKDKQPATKSKAEILSALSEVALTEAKQLKIATKRSLIQTYSSHASGSGDGFDTQSKVPDKQIQKKAGTDEGAGDDDDDANKESDSHDDNKETKTDDESDDFVHPNLSTYTADDQAEEENVEKEENAEDDDDMSDQRVHTPPNYQLSKESEKQEGNDKVVEGEDEYDDEEMLYGDLNLNLERRDTDMTEPHTDTYETHVTLTADTPVVQQQSSSASDLVSKYIIPTMDEGIDSILNLNIQSDTFIDIPVTTEAPSTVTTTFQSPIPNIHSLQQTPDPLTSTTFPTTITVQDIPNFASLFGFNQRVTVLESDMSMLKQSNLFVEAISSIPGIVDAYLASKMKEAVDVAIQLKSNKLREEAQVENQEFLNSLDSNMNKIIKEQVKAQT